MESNHMVKEDATKTQQCIDLSTLFSGLQEQMRQELQLARAVIPHNGDMGSACESKWREMLTRHLPSRYQVEKGIVVDSNGDCSDSIDIIVFDRQYTNLLLAHGGQYFIPAESVYAVFEAKQEISRETLLYAGEKAESVRRLARTSAPIHHAEGVAKPKPPVPILAGLICLESGWSPTHGEPFKRVMNELFPRPNARLDLGCCVNQGSFEALFTEAAPIIETSLADNSLIFFMFRLMKRLQQLGTVSAIDFNAYEKWIE